MHAYSRVVLDNIADALLTSMLDVVGNGDAFPNGVVFMMDKYTKEEDDIFPIQTYDWDRIKTEIAPLVDNVIRKFEEAKGKILFGFPIDLYILVTEIFMNREDLEKAITQIVQLQLPGKSIKALEDKGVWIKHIFKVTFNDDSNIYIKLAVCDYSDILIESNVVDLLRKNGIYQPSVIKVDTSCTKLHYPFIIQDGGTGEPLSYYLARNDTYKLKHIYHSIG